MRNIIKQSWRGALVCLLCLSLLSIGAATRFGQDQNFRLMNLERRVDQLQTRLDYVERAQQTQSLNPGNTPNYQNEMVLELQRQFFNQGQQVVHLQKQMLDMQKEVDRLTERVAAGQKAERSKETSPAKPEEGGKPKNTTRKPL
jgi:hypothetical protein